MRYLPSPTDAGAVEGHAVDDPEEVLTREPSSSAPMCALAFKIATDPLCRPSVLFFRRVFRRCRCGSYVLNSRSGKKERVSRLFQMHSNKQNAKGDDRLR